jgi:predicted phosphodiesterase
MKIQFCSDLHLEMRPQDYKLAQTDADIIVLAGDVHVGINAIEFAIVESDRQKKPVIIIAGNHEFYGHDYHHMLNKMTEAAKHHPLVHFLENNEVVIDGVRFLGCTLWTDYLGDDAKHEALNMAYCGRMLRDHVVIRNGAFNFAPVNAQKICHISKQYLTQKLDSHFPGKTIVVSHHGPSLACQHKHYKFSEISAAFVSNMDDLVRKADLWVYGHSHSNLDTKVGDCRLVSNQQGYPGENIPVPFKPNWVVEV